MGCRGAVLLFVLAGGGQDRDLPCTVSWVGNTFSGKEAWVLQDVADLHVEPDGTVFTNIFWDEAGGNVQEFKDGKLVRVARHTHGWGYEGGDAIAANAKYLFIVQEVNNEGGGLKGSSWPAKGLRWSGVSRRLRSDITKGVPFPGGRGKEGDVIPGAFLPVAEFPEGERGALRGAAASETRLYVSSPFHHAIRIYDAESLQPAGEWTVERPDKICLDREGCVWVLQRPAAPGRPWAALRFGPDGSPRPQKVVFDPGVDPSDLCVDGRDRLLVADAGPDQQVKIYENSSKAPVPRGALGVKGGIWAGPVPGKFGALRFNRPLGVGADAAGNVYVASSGSVAGGSTVLESYSPGGALRWRLLGLTFVDLAALDPGSETDVFTKEERFVLDYAKPPGQEWSYAAYTVDPWRYPDDPRLHLGPTHCWVRRLGGGRFLFVSDMTGEFLAVFRFDPGSAGEIAIPCALYSRRAIRGKGGWPPHQPPKGEWMWRDADGNGRIDAGEVRSWGGDAGGLPEPDDTGAIWQCTGGQIRCVPVTPPDARGIPAWDFAQARSWPKPPELDEVRRVRYLAASDTMILGGNRGADRNQHWKPMGPVLCCYDRWSDPAGRKPRWNVVLPYRKGSRGHESAEPISFDAAGDYLFVGYTRGLPEDGVRWAYVRVHRLSDASHVGNLVAERALGEIGLLDIVESVHASRRPNGEYVIFLEDDYKSKVVLFRWRPR